MRSVGTQLACLCLLAVAPWASAAIGKGTPAPSSYPSWEVVGYGPAQPDAEQDALSKASQTVYEFLETTHPSIAWTPPGAYLKQRGAVRLVGEPTIKELERSGRVVEVRLRVQVTRELLEESLHMSRQQRMEERQHGLALGLGGAMAVLIVLGGYLRLEEATRGYYTRMLRLTAAGVLAVVGVGLWLLR